MPTALALVLLTGTLAGTGTPAPDGRAAQERVIPPDSRWAEGDGSVWEFRKRGELQTWSENGEKHFPSRYAVKTTTNPAQIDIITIDGTALGIYRVKGDRLEVCWACPGVERPTRFAPRKEGQDLLILRRVKPRK
jgi:uncharacterized protein (TIGR03067 family)